MTAAFMFEQWQTLWSSSDTEDNNDKRTQDDLRPLRNEILPWSNLDELQQCGLVLIPSNE